VFTCAIILRSELERRKRDHPRYSLRAFARQLGLSPAFLSKVLRSRGELSAEKSRRVALRLGYSQEATEQFVALAADTVREKRARQEAESLVRGAPDETVYSLDAEALLRARARIQRLLRDLERRRRTGAQPSYRVRVRLVLE
jgi:transcriptional regulator with XRE-family HTH domain